MIRLHRWLILALTLVAACPTMPEPVVAQVVDTVGWTHDSTAAGLDTTSWQRDSTPVTSWHYDSTAITAVHWVYDSTPVTQPHVTPPPVMVGSCPNEPKGFTLVSDRPFTPLPSAVAWPAGTELDRGWVSTGAFSLVQDPTAPDGDGWVGQEIYPAGAPAGKGTMASWLAHDFIGKGYRQVYTCFWMKVDPTYVGDGSGVNKQFWVQVGPTAENRVFMLLDSPGLPPSNTWPMYFSIRLQGMGNVISSNAYSNKSQPVARGEWHRFEMLLTMNSTSTAADGQIATYTDGLLSRTITGLQFTKPGEVPEVRSVKWNNTYGGQYGPVPHRQWIRIDAQRVLVH